MDFNRLDHENNNINNYVRHAFSSTKRYWIGTIHGINNETITNKNEFTNFIHNFGGNHRIVYAEISAPHTNQELGYHQHFLIICKEPVRMSKTQFNIGNNKIFNCYYPPTSIYSTRTGDFSGYIKYMRNQNTNNEIFINYDPEKKLQDDNTTIARDTNKKPSFDNALNYALQMEDQREALEYLRELYPEKMLSNEGKFRTRHQTVWNLHNFNKSIDERSQNFNPWKDEEGITIKIRKWAKDAAESEHDRKGILFIVGPTKTGKTEFVLSEIARKYPTYYARGEFNFQYFNNDIDYKLYIFDDVPFRTRQDLDTLKSLVSMVGQPAQMNVKYDIKLVPSRPVIVLLNEDGMNRIKYLINNYLYTHKKDDIYNKPTVDWWHENSTIINVYDKLYYTQDEMKEYLMEEIESNDSEEEISFSETNETVDDDTSQSTNDQINMENLINNDNIENDEKKPKTPKDIEEMDDEEVKQKFLEKIKKERKSPYRKAELFMEYLNDAGVFENKDEEDISELKRKIIKYEHKIHRDKKNAKKYAFGKSLSKILEEEIEEDIVDTNLTNDEGIPYMDALDDYNNNPDDHNDDYPIERSNTPFLNAPPLKTQFNDEKENKTSNINNNNPISNNFNIFDGDYEFIQD